MLAHGGLQCALGDESGNFGMDRVWASVLFFVGLGQMAYILANHRELLLEKVNIFFLMPLAPRARFIFVWALAFAGWILVESWGDWSVTRILSHSQQLRLADQDLLDGRLNEATFRYGYAANKVVNSDKAHFNHGSLLLIPRDEPGGYQAQAQEALLALRKAPRFPYAALTEANLWSLSGGRERARVALREQYGPEQTHILQQTFQRVFWKYLPIPVLWENVRWNWTLIPVGGILNQGFVYANQGEPELAADFQTSLLPGFLMPPRPAAADLLLGAEHDAG
ncbi:MAG: hypothetical protein R3B47_19925 [Bacteroidia bacterium]